MQFSPTEVVISWIVLIVIWEVGRRKFYPKVEEFYFKRTARKKVTPKKRRK